MEAVAADKRREYRAAALGLVFEWKRRQAGEGQKEAGEGHKEAGESQKEAREWMKAVAAGKRPEYHEYRAACAILPRADVRARLWCQQIRSRSVRVG